MTDDTKKIILRDMLRKQTYTSMKEAKGVLHRMLTLERNSVTWCLTINQFLQLLPEPKDPISYGDEWGWSNLYWDILSNKYGAAALRDERAKKTTFTLRLPPVEKLTK